MDTLEDFRNRVRAASAARSPLRVRGGGTKDFYGTPLDAQVLDTREHAGIVAHEPTELYVRARCGTPLAEIEDALDAEGQMLAFEPPRFGVGTTLGGVVAAGLAGPRRAHAGGVRDFVLGIEIVDGRGEALRFGGQVIKNVAGYDVSRLMAGSLGTLGVITEVTLKVMPRPAAELTLRFALDERSAIDAMNRRAGEPLPVSATAWHDGALTLRLSGASPAVAAARGRLGGEVLSDIEAGEFWTALRDQTHPFFSGTPLWRLALPSAAPPLALPGAQLIEWHGGLRWLASDAEPARIRAAAEAAGGSAALFRAPDALKRSAGVFPPLAAPAAAIHRRLKQTFDPSGIFNPGRMYADL